jgi:UDP-glucose 4-epimerase
VPLLRGCDAVVHLAWLIQPMRDREVLRRVNVHGTENVLRAAGQAGVSTVVHMSSVGAYSAAKPGRRVREDWPTQGIETCSYSVDKAACERLADRFEAEHPDVRVARLRPAIITQAGAASQQVDYFLGGRVPGVARLIGRGIPPAVLPWPSGLVIQMVHADDVAQAFVHVLRDDGARGAYNVASEPELGARAFGRALNAVPVPVPAAAARAAVDAAYRLHVVPTEPGWLDMGIGTPLLDTDRIRTELGWEPTRPADEALDEVLAGVRAGSAGPTPPLQVPSDA